MEIKNIRLDKDRSNLIEYVGGLDKAFEYMVVLRQHSVCCDYWYMQNVMGKGRASHRIVERKLAVSNDEGFTLKELEDALQRFYILNALSVEGNPKVVYRDASEPPKTKFGLSPSNLWEESEELILKCIINGETKYVIGKYKVPNYQGGVSGYKLSGYNGDWNECVKGWAYV